MCLNLVGLRACLNLVGLRKIEFGRINQQTKSQKCTNPPQAGIASDITSSMYGKGHVALNKVNQNFLSGTPPPFNKPNTQAADGTWAQPYGIYLPCRLPDHHTSVLSANYVTLILWIRKLNLTTHYICAEVCDMSVSPRLTLTICVPLAKWTNILAISHKVPENMISLMMPSILSPSP
uniref:Uncharacterized protein n=1 Tax=Glossina palpalis gambiensis TaxID=67801 RepID=A0A1B0BVT9_9MUSC